MSQEEAEYFYKNLKEPPNLVMHIEDFDTWLDLAEDLESLECTLSAFEAYDMFEHCIKIRNKIKRFKDESTNQHSGTH